VARSETGGNAIQPGSRYTVGPGDMLSTIAARVAGRPDWSVWPIAQQIYASNPGAFLLGDPNMLAQGATIYIPTLNEVDLSNTGPAAVAAATSSRSAPPQASTQNGAVAQTPPTPAAVTQNLATAPPAASAAQAAVPVVREPLPSMQITATLMSESRMKLELRRQGSPVPSVVALPESTPTSVDPNVTPEPEPIPSTTPEQPANVSEQPRVALSERSGLGWSFIGAGWLLAFLLGVLLTALVTRRRRKADDDDEFYVPEQSYRPEPATAAPVVAAPVATPTPIDFGDDDRFAGESSDASPAFNETTPTVEIPSMIDQDLGDTAEFEAYKGLDLELPHDEPARVGDPETLEMPQVAESLDLELPTTEHGETGQHDVDFDLLEQAYSDEYHAEYIAARDDETAPTAELPQPGQNDDTARFYHLENRDPADEAPLPIELGEDEMTGDSADDDNVVNFPKSSSSG
ncbi:MAG: hypothetical protein HKN49_04445, partial [Gammaproteobacteria bacterium]|nr:hypothetical protein [Gammaproteobacteria bacterium]